MIIRHYDPKTVHDLLLLAARHRWFCEFMPLHGAMMAAWQPQ
ncbi:hypothetical protein MAUB1S_06918 [Mycolicibacterium aubagnense]